MAIVATTQQRVDGGYWSRQIKCDSKGTFTCDLPNTVSILLGVPSSISGKTLQEVEYKWDQILREYRDSKTSIRKVILYRFEARCELEYKGKYFTRSDFSFSQGQILGISVGVYKETTVVISPTQSNVTYEGVKSEIPYKCYPRPVDVIHNHTHEVIDWTPEREDFFVQLVNSFDLLIARVLSFTEDTDQFVKLMESRTKLLGTPS